MERENQAKCWCGSTLKKGQEVCKFCFGPFSNPKKYTPLTVDCQNAGSGEPWISGSVCCICFIRETCQKRVDYISRENTNDYQKGGEDDQISGHRMA